MGLKKAEEGPLYFSFWHRKTTQVKVGPREVAKKHVDSRYGHVVQNKIQRGCQCSSLASRKKLVWWEVAWP